MPYCMQVLLQAPKAEIVCSAKIVLHYVPTACKSMGAQSDGMLQHGHCLILRKIIFSPARHFIPNSSRMSVRYMY